MLQQLYLEGITCARKGSSKVIFPSVQTEMFSTFRLKDRILFSVNLSI